MKETNGPTVELTYTIQAPPEMIFEALTDANALREWFCVEARTEPHKEGHFKVGWYSGYEARGVFTVFSPPHRLAFTWLGTNEPGETNVHFAIEPVEDGTRLTLTHIGFETGEAWAGQAENAERNWKIVLRNLQSVLETGLDRREARQPGFGAAFETNETHTAVVLLDVFPGGPVAKAGLRRGDVITSMGGKGTRDEQELLKVLFAHRPGQSAEIEYVREGESQTTTIEFGQRPVPEAPDTPAAVVKQAKEIHERALAALRTSVARLTDEQAGQVPVEGEWSVKEILAHLSICERLFQAWVGEELRGRHLPPYDVEARLPEQFAAVLSTTPTVSGLLDRLEGDMAESRTFVAALTPEHLVYKARYRRIALALLGYAGHVEYPHVGQVQAAVRAVQG